MMRVTVRQRGGFAGVDAELASVDTATLDAASRSRVEQQVRAALKEPPEGGGIGADQLTYEITVDEGGERKTVTWEDDGTGGAAPVRDLIARLSEVK